MNDAQMVEAAIRNVLLEIKDKPGEPIEKVLAMLADEIAKFADEPQ